MHLAIPYRPKNSKPVPGFRRDIDFLCATKEKIITPFFVTPSLHSAVNYSIIATKPAQINSKKGLRGCLCGFNGKEMDNEVSGSGNQYDYGFRIYNPRIGKFLSVDPLFKSFPWYTPYQFAGNKPIWCFDLDGKEDIAYLYRFNPKTQRSTLMQIVTKENAIYHEFGTLGTGVLTIVDFGDYYRYQFIPAESNKKTTGFDFFSSKPATGIAVSNNREKNKFNEPLQPQGAEYINQKAGTYERIIDYLIDLFAGEGKPDIGYDNEPVRALDPDAVKSNNSERTTKTVPMRIAPDDSVNHTFYDDKYNIEKVVYGPSDKAGDTIGTKILPLSDKRDVYDVYTNPDKQRQYFEKHYKK